VLQGSAVGVLPLKRCRDENATGRHYSGQLREHTRINDNILKNKFVFMVYCGVDRRRTPRAAYNRISGFTIISLFIRGCAQCRNADILASLKIRIALRPRGLACGAWV
jgi:hypothetical protein